MSVTPKKELAKAYAPQDVEKKWYDTWEAGGLFYAYRPDESPQDPTGRRAVDKAPFVVCMPPPNVTGILHMGHALNNTIQDTYIRYHRMLGHEALWMPGTDHAGIATQTKVEKQLKEEGLSRRDLGREKFLDRVWQWKHTHSDFIEKQLRALGCGPDWRRFCFTMDEGYYNAVIEAFVRLHEKGLIYRGKRIINWSPLAQSALSDEEVIYKETQGKLHFFRYPLIDRKADEPEYIVIATTRPETMLGDVAVAVNPFDERYQKLIGRKLMLPLMNREIPIIADDYVDKEFGTGCVKITPAHDPNDFEIGLRHNLPQLNVMYPDATINEQGGKYSGLDRYVARKKIIADLEELGLIEKIEDYTNSVGYSERGGEMIEPYLSDQWFVKMKPLAEPALKVVEDGLIQFHPERWINTYRHWMTNIRDWCISRQLWWGHRIPAWYGGSGEVFVGRTAEDARAKADAAGYTGHLHQDEDVLDTWFSSWLWPFATFGWPENTKDLQTFYPGNLLSTAPDIIFFWVARMIMAGIEFMKDLPKADGSPRTSMEDIVPFKHVYFHNIIRDQIGRKMSKSLGNSPDPIDLVQKYGTDAVRFTLLYLAPLGQDVRFGEESCEQGRNFANKLWNATRFVMMKRDEYQSNKSEPTFESEDTELLNSTSNEPRIQSNTKTGFTAKPATTLADKWILSRANKTAFGIKESLDNYLINDATKKLYDFIWKDYCDWYLEVVKLQPESTLLAVEILEGILRMLHPVMPFVTEELWHALTGNEESVLIGQDDYITSDEGKIDPEAEADFEFIQKIIEAARLLRANAKLTPSKPAKFILRLKNDSDHSLSKSARLIIERLCRAEALAIEVDGGGELSSNEYSSELLSGRGQIFMKLEVLSAEEAAKEQARIAKERERVSKQYQSLLSKLSDDNFVSRAPAHI
ncbi:MAG TPA: valine--tRNA ligase, partial [Candidatus Kapabacteria bacterium]|nr:valine--tRNA ligase [Candidatus Kapabacteria bacterium]